MIASDYKGSETNNSTDSNSKSHLDCYLSPCDVFSIAGAIALMLYREFSLCQLYVIINLMGLIVGNLNAIITQMEINRGEQPSTLV